MLSSIGGFYDINLDAFQSDKALSIETYFNLSSDNSTVVNSGANAFSLILNNIEPEGEILIPDYWCWESLFPVVKDRKLKVRFYPVKNFTIEPEDITPCINKNTQAILLINYYGIYRQDKITDSIKELNKDIITILDCAQDPFYFAQVPLALQKADYAFSSFRKVFPVVDGGFVRSKKAVKNETLSLNTGYSEAFVKMIVSSFLKSKFIDKTKDLKDLETLAVELYNQAEASHQQDQSIRGMTQISEFLMERLNVDEIKNRRQSNYRYLSEQLAGCHLVDVIERELDEGLIPLCMPVYVSGNLRDALRKWLSEKMIFCPVHWPVREEFVHFLSERTSERSQQMLSLVLDQRYGEHELARMVHEIHLFEKEHS